MSFSVRNIREDDLTQIARWRMDPNITRFMNTDPVLTPESQLAWFQGMQNDQTHRYWLVENGGEGCGVIQLNDIDREKKTASWGYYIGVKRLRSIQLALALEMSLYDYVFDTLGFEEIQSDVFALNAGVIRLHLMCGCEIRETVENEVQKNGISYDVTHLYLTKERWVALRENKRYQKIDFRTQPEDI